MFPPLIRFDEHAESLFRALVLRRCTRKGKHVTATRFLWIGLASALVVGAVVAGLAFAPQLLVPASPTENPGTTQGPDVGAASAPIGVPTWAVGDDWSYNVTLTAVADGHNVTLVKGRVTETVVGVLPDQGQGEAYNVTVDGTFALDPSAAAMAGLAMRHDLPPIVFTEATVSGYSWYRTADLAKLTDVRSLKLSGSAGMHASAHLTVDAQATYDPPWDHWSFPMEEDEGWNVTTKATVQGQAVLRVDYPSGWVEVGHNFSFEAPLNYSVASGEFEDVETPAGVFSALPTVVEPHLPDAADAMAAEVSLALDLGMSGDHHRPRAVAWFSADAGNVVRAIADSSGALQLEAVLVEFHHTP